MYLCGQPGLGKTLTVQAALRSIGSNYSFESVSSVSIGFLNGAAISDPYSSLHQALSNCVIKCPPKLPPFLTEASSPKSDSYLRREFVDHFNSQGHILTRISNGHKAQPPHYSIIVVDEIDLAPRSFIRELYELSKRSTLFLIGIANSIDVSQCLGMFDCQDIIFENYNGNDVVEIFTARVGELIEPRYIDVLQKKVVKDSGYQILLLNISGLRWFLAY